MKVIEISSDDDSSDEDLCVVQIINNKDNVHKFVSDEENDDVEFIDDVVNGEEFVTHKYSVHSSFDDQEIIPLEEEGHWKSVQELVEVNQPKLNFCLKNCYVKLDRRSAKLATNEILKNDTFCKIQTRRDFNSASESSSDEHYESYEYSKLPTFSNEGKGNALEYGSMNSNASWTESSSENSGRNEIKKEPMKERKSKRLKKRNKEVWEAIKCIFSDDEEGPLVCSECGTTFTHMYRLSKHIKMVHLNLKPYQCTKCEESFSSYDQFYDHNMIIHKVIVLKDEKLLKQFKCPDCGAVFKNDGMLFKHIRYTHDKYKPYRCVPCNLTFAEKPSLTAHNHSFHPSWPTQEKLKPVNINKSDSRPSVDSMSTSTNRAKVNVKEENKCESRFERKESLVVKRELTCDKLKWSRCELSFTKKSMLARHENRVHNTDAASDEEAFEQIRCSECKSIFVDNRLLLEHIEFVHCKTETFSCPICGLTFRRSVQLIRHVNDAHADDETSCPSIINDHATPLLEGSEEYVDNDSLISHDLKTVLGLTKSHKCSKCKLSFDTDCSLSSHFRVVHNVIKQQICTVCCKNFLNFRQFKNHICYSCENRYSNKYLTYLFEPDVKLNQRPRSRPILSVRTRSSMGKNNETSTDFKANVNKSNNRAIKSASLSNGGAKRKKNNKCSKCGKCFRSVSALEYHVSTAHENKQLRCLKCNKIFSLERQLLLHMDLVHKPDSYECTHCDIFFLLESHLQEHREACHSI